jgi:hypothetical protein
MKVTRLLNGSDVSSMLQLLHMLLIKSFHPPIFRSTYLGYRRLKNGEVSSMIIKLLKSIKYHKVNISEYASYHRA